jgi:hypothetical protein
VPGEEPFEGPSVAGLDLTQQATCLRGAGHDVGHGAPLFSYLRRLAEMDSQNVPEGEILAIRHRLIGCLGGGSVYGQRAGLTAHLMPTVTPEGVEKMASPGRPARVDGTGATATGSRTKRPDPVPGFQPTWPQLNLGYA